MVAMIYAENADVVGRYDSWAEAQRDLETFVLEHPELRDEIGLRVYEYGAPIGGFMSAADVLQSDRQPQAEPA